MTGSVPVITVDGPVGTGKGTVCAGLSTQLGWHLLDSGALYRAVGLAALRRGVDLDDGESIAALASALQVRFSRDDRDPEPIRTWLDGEDVSALIRTEECGSAASRIAGHPAVRAKLLAHQRGFRREPGLVADGRDMGTVVFPDATLKVYLTASVEVRAQRRHKQLKEKGIDVSLPRLFSDISARDQRDQERSVSPLRPADDAVVLDTSERNAAEVLALVLEWVRKRCPGTAQTG